MEKVKFEVIKDWLGDVLGYKLGNYLLFKKYYYKNQYSWYISKETDYFKAMNDSNKQYVSSCKKGKELLISLSK